MNVKGRSRNRAHRGEFDAHDARVLCHIPPRVITSPNNDWVPQPFMFEDTPVQAHANAVKRNFNFADEPLAAVWYTPSYDDFPHKLDALAKLMDLVKVRVNTYKNGKHHLQAGDQSIKMVQSLHVTFNHLNRFPLTYRDIVTSVTEFQHGVLEFHAYCDYYAFILPCIERPQFPFPAVNTQWMGAFTEGVQVAEALFRAGVPMWYVCPEASVTSSTIIEAIVTPTQPDHIVLAAFCDPIKKFAKPFPVRYVGPAGVERETASRHFNTESKMEAYKILVGEDAPSEGGHPWPRNIATPRNITGDAARIGQRVPDHVNPSQGSGSGSGPRNKWVDLDHQLLPPHHVTWSTALDHVTKDEKGVKSQRMNAGYRFPEPVVFAVVLVSDSRKQYLANWLALRPLWLGRIANQPHLPVPGPKVWHAFLNSTLAAATPSTATSSTAIITLSMECKSAAVQFFGEHLADMGTASTWAGDISINFRGNTIKLATLADPPLQLIQGILWELAELSFRYDLLTLDKFLIPQLWADSPHERQVAYDSVFPSEVVGGTWDAPLPTESVGLCHSDIRADHFLPFINAFRTLMSHWPSAPALMGQPLLEPLADTTLNNKVGEALRFYVESFFVNTGRPPVVPRRMPGTARA
ncbi:hypothetical protein BU15DRAFT_65573 [Melanogaster broomeanus]|nr:hypothetical protein BU15DRAFT_65573 [Melanogaster broomeanus]